MKKRAMSRKNLLVNASSVYGMLTKILITTF